VTSAFFPIRHSLESWIGKRVLTIQKGTFRPSFFEYSGSGLFRYAAGTLQENI
jgi:hypothetical protein